MSHIRYDIRYDKKQAARRGGFVIIAMACLAIAGILFTVTLTTISRHRQRQHNDLWTAQAELLADSAIDRAVCKMQTDGNYTGETWLIPAELLDAGVPARVEIQVDDTTIHVTAMYPDPDADAGSATDVRDTRIAPSIHARAERVLEVAGPSSESASVREDVQ